MESPPIDAAANGTQFQSGIPLPVKCDPIELDTDVFYSNLEDSVTRLYYIFRM